jgi:cell division protein FtsI (penicillin-binding protein 3)
MAQTGVSRRAAVPRWRINILLILLVLASIITSRQLVVVQVLGEHRGRQLDTLAQQELTTHAVLQPRRGTIYDRNGVALAMNVNKPSLYVDPTKIADPDKLAILLAPIIGADPTKLGEVLSDNTQQWARLKRWLEPEAAEQVEKLEQKECTGKCMYLVDEAKREYPQGTFASRVVGVANYEGVGITGVEAFFDSEIKGITGTLRAERDGSVNQNPILIAPQEVVEPQDGYDVKLTIDSAVQKMAEDELQRVVAEQNPSSATILVMEPQTGEVLALATYPSFDPNNFTGYTAEQINHNNVLAAYEPGSTFKPIMTAMGLQTGAFTSATTVTDTGSIVRGGHRISNWNNKKNGDLTPEMMLYYSSNVGAVQFAEMIGVDNFYNYVKLFGYGEPTGIDLGGEEGGIVKWPGGEQWTPTDLSTNSFGQAIAVTPIQHLNAYGALANGGSLMWPHVVKELCHDDQCKPVEPRVIRQVVDQTVTDQLRSMLVHAAERYGGAMWSPHTGISKDQPLVPGYRVAAKTGTSQIPGPNGGYEVGVTIASVAGWAPAEQPRATVLVRIDRPKKAIYGSDVAIPVFQRLLARLMVHYRIPPDLNYVGAGQKLGGLPVPSSAPTRTPTSLPNGAAPPSEAVVPTPTMSSATP